jgi:hypothetical protein
MFSRTVPTASQIPAVQVCDATMFNSFLLQGYKSSKELRREHEVGDQLVANRKNISQLYFLLEKISNSCA